MSLQFSIAGNVTAKSSAVDKVIVELITELLHCTIPELYEIRKDWPEEWEGRLLDGYISYLLLKKHGIKHVPVRYGKRQIIKAYHRPGGKLYTWELPGRLVDGVTTGDKVAVVTNGGVRCVTVAAVEEYGGAECSGPLKKVVRKIKSRITETE